MDNHSLINLKITEETINHLKNCQNEENCSTPNCKNVRIALKHVEKCCEPICSVCEAVKQAKQYQPSTSPSSWFKKNSNLSLPKEDISTFKSISNSSQEITLSSDPTLSTINYISETTLSDKTSAGMDNIDKDVLLLNTMASQAMASIYNMYNKSSTLMGDVSCATVKAPAGYSEGSQNILCPESLLKSMKECSIQHKNSSASSSSKQNNVDSTPFKQMLFEDPVASDKSCLGETASSNRRQCQEISATLPHYSRKDSDVVIPRRVVPTSGNQITNYGEMMKNLCSQSPQVQGVENLQPSNHPHNQSEEVVNFQPPNQPQVVMRNIPSPKQPQVMMANIQPPNQPQVMMANIQPPNQPQVIMGNIQPPNQPQGVIGNNQPQNQVQDEIIPHVNPHDIPPAVMYKFFEEALHTSSEEDIYNYVLNFKIHAASEVSRMREIIQLGLNRDDNAPNLRPRKVAADQDAFINYYGKLVERIYIREEDILWFRTMDGTERRNTIRKLILKYYPFIPDDMKPDEVNSMIDVIQERHENTIYLTAKTRREYISNLGVGIREVVSESL